MGIDRTVLGLAAGLRTSASKLARLRRRPTIAPPRQDPPAGPGDYHARVTAERSFFGVDASVHRLPAIYDYWSNTHLRPALESLGFPHPNAVFLHHFKEAYARGAGRERVFVSIGAGNCATEIDLAAALLDAGLDDFRLQCVELNAGLLADAAKNAARRGLSAHIEPVAADFNAWTPTTMLDGVLANSSLHHVVNLEGLLDNIRRALLPTGTFVTSDTVGRNGHLRWPEALGLVREYWQELPPRYRYNRQLRRQEDTYEDWDCSNEGFEGIRAQDILPLLVAHFDFDVFAAFANIVDPFIDRSFGHNFSVDEPWDTAFIDKVHARDAAEIQRGAIKPTHVVAAMCTGRPGRNVTLPGLTPAFCVRRPHDAPVPFRSIVVADGVVVPPPADETARAAGASVTDTPASYSDLWSDPATPGWGLSIHHGRHGALMANWLVYDAHGRPTWYSLQPGRWLDDTTFEATVYATSAQASGRNVACTTARLRMAGEASIRFHDLERATLTWRIDDEAGEARLVRMRG
jgi:SAM-dependent methyltransferase